MPTSRNGNGFTLSFASGTHQHGADKQGGVIYLFEPRAPFVVWLPGGYVALPGFYGGTKYQAGHDRAGGYIALPGVGGGTKYQAGHDRAGNGMSLGFYSGTKQSSFGVAPSVSNVTPTAGSLLTPTSVVSFDVTDVGGIALLQVQTDQFRREVVYDGTTFLDPYTGSAVATITNGFHFTVVRTGGWVIAPVFHLFAVDDHGDVS